MANNETKTVTIYYCGLCEQRPQVEFQDDVNVKVEIVKRNHSSCVTRVGLPIIEGVSKAITNMAYVSKR
ncbi:hypothetical protein KKB83_00695 [Patescibacteria group bacterium]|nr:hypothetical protein [Patescibacteria group bacterium]